MVGFPVYVMLEFRNKRYSKSKEQGRHAGLGRVSKIRKTASANLIQISAETRVMFSGF